MIICLVSYLLTGPAKAERLHVNLTAHEVAVTSSFTGARITLFGAIQRTSDGLAPSQQFQNEDIIVAVIGPSEDLTVRRKERVGGIWVNRDAITFKRVPSVYYLASTRPVDEILSQSVRMRNELGPDYISLDRYEAHSDISSDEDIESFRQAMIRKKKEIALYGEDERGVRVQANTLFSMDINIPANVPVGKFSVRVFLVRDGVILQSQSIQPSVSKKGIERMIYSFAHVQPLFYGITAVIVAAFAGWLASVIFRQR